MTGSGDGPERLQRQSGEVLMRVHIESEEDKRVFREDQETVLRRSRKGAKRSEEELENSRIDFREGLLSSK